MVIKVTVFGTKRMPTCDFLLVSNTNLHPILHRFQDIVIIGQIFAVDRGCLSLTQPLGMNP